MTNLFTLTENTSATPARPRRFARSWGWLTALVLLLGGSNPAWAQPTWISGRIASSTYVSYTLNDLGTFRQRQIQATASQNAGDGDWAFTIGVGAPSYATSWRPQNLNTQIPGYNVSIDPAVSAGSARYWNPGGNDGRLPATTSNNYYTFNVTENAASNNFMAVLQTTYNPVTISSVSVPSAPA